MSCHGKYCGWPCRTRASSQNINWRFWSRLVSRLSCRKKTVRCHAKHKLRLEHTCGVPDSHSRIGVGLDSGQSITCIPISFPQSSRGGEHTDPFPLRVSESTASPLRRLEDRVVSDARQPVGFPLGCANRLVEHFAESDVVRAGTSVLPRVGGKWNQSRTDVRDHEPIKDITTSKYFNLLTETLHEKWWYEKEQLSSN